jgi:beta-lactamase regulating signal transducer with metallopeptidase domain
MIWWIAQTACTSALLAAIVAIVARAGRLSPAVKHAMWLLVLVKLMTPPLGLYRLPSSAERARADCTAWLMRGERRLLAESAVGTGPINRALAEAELALADLPQTDAGLRVEPELWIGDGPRDTAARASSLEAVEVFEAPTADAELTATSDREAASRYAEFGWLLAAVWLLGAVPLTVVQSTRIIRLHRFLTDSAPVPAWLDGLVQQIAAQLNIRPPRVVVVPALCSPLVCALGRPRLLWPQALGDQLPHEARKAVLLHELAHLRRRDHWVAWLELAAGVVWWFNPLYWYVRHQLRENAELACDAWVVGLLPAGRRAYAQALIEVTEFVSLAPAAMPAVAMGNVARRTLERRLTMIMRERLSYRVPLLGTGLIGLSLLAVLPGFSGGQDALPALDSAPKENAATGLPGASDDSAESPALGDSSLPESASLALPLDSQTIRRTQPVAATTDEQDGAGRFDQPPTTNQPLGDTIADPEERIRQLEAQLTQLQNAVQALRGDSQATRAQKALDSQSGIEPPKPLEPQVFRSNKASPSGGYIQYLAQDVVANQAKSEERYAIETVTRGRYKLPGELAGDLATFLKGYAKAGVEATADKEILTIIASPEDQAKIGAFIELLRSEQGPAAPGQQETNKNSRASSLSSSQPQGSISDSIITLPARR